MTNMIAFDQRRENRLRLVFVAGSIVSVAVLMVLTGYAYGSLYPLVRMLAPHNPTVAIMFMGALLMLLTICSMPAVLFIGAGAPEPGSLVTVLDGGRCGDVHVRCGAAWAFFTRLDGKSRRMRKRQVLSDVFATIIRHASGLSDDERAATTFVLTTNAIHDRTAHAFGLAKSERGLLQGRMLGTAASLVSKAQRLWTGGKAYEYRRRTLSGTDAAALADDARIQRLIHHTMTQHCSRGRS
jgi:hypothetical protein